MKAPLLDEEAAGSRSPQTPHRRFSVDVYIKDHAGGWGAYQRRLERKLQVNYAFLAVDQLAGIFLVQSMLDADTDALPLLQQQWIKATCFFLGGFVGFMTSGPLADLYGRRPTLLAFNTMRCVTTLVTFAAPSLPVLLVGRCISGVCTNGAFNTMYPLLAEFAPSDRRARVKRDLGIVWQIGVAYLVIGAYLLRGYSWHALALLFAPSLLAAGWMHDIPESPRFLVVQDRLCEAVAILETAAKVNGHPPPSLDCELLPRRNVDARIAATGALGHLQPLFSSGMLPITLGLMATTFVASGTYYGLTFAPGSTGGGNVYTTQLFSSLLELPATIGAAYLADALGRRSSLAILFGVGALTFLFLGALPFTDRLPESLGWLPMAALLTGRASASAATTLKYVLISESYPTVARSSGIAFLSVFGQLGGWLAPQAFGVVSNPLLVFAALLALVPCVLYSSVPETRGKTLV